MLRNYSGYQISKMVNPSKQTKCIANSQPIFPDTLQETLYVEKKHHFLGKPMDLSSFDLLPHQTLWVPGHRHGADPVTLPLSFRADESATSKFFSPGNSCGYCKIYTHTYNIYIYTKNAGFYPEFFPPFKHSWFPSLRSGLANFTTELQQATDS